MSDITATKSELRRQLRAARRALPPATQHHARDRLTHTVTQLPDWHLLQRIGLYLAADGEIDPSLLAEQLLTEGKQVYLPVIQDDKTLQFGRWQGSADELIANRYGISEPRPESTRAATVTLDCICLPLVAWSETGKRLGMGGGYYDRTLADLSGPLRVGLGYEMQREDALPGDAWDVDLDFVATEAALYRCRT
ncbi:5-formyltetrahydrofolate cyclo-ligase [Halioglobus sp. HI00S01]|uniref:5-formyltetrahydrofolate cyclo-ligase n=1 Tax=Halioglobus sp. HI00S01 TaxID=1822214 RepID=UPI000824F912|nr:5-formyltetrahydrofolate cyclo-ligase [Halioglobus sp. HI00S01]